MKYCIKHFDSLAKNEWDNFVDKNPASCLWHSYDFIIAKNTWRNHSNVSFCITNEQDNIIAIFPLFLIKAKSLKIFNTPVLENTGGWLIDEKKSNVDISALLIAEFKNILKNHSCSIGYINFNSASLKQKIDPFFIQGIQGQRNYISVIDLTKPQTTIWENFRKGHQSEIKKAQKKGVDFKFAKPEDMEIYYKMHQEVCHRSLIKPHTKQYFEHIFYKLLPQKKACIGIAHLNNEPIAIINYGVYNHIATYWTGACFEIAYKTGANHFLHWCMIQELIKQKVAQLDMGEVFLKHASEKLEGIASFKLGFGGELFPCFKNQFCNSKKIQTILGWFRE